MQNQSRLKSMVPYILLVLGMTITMSVMIVYGRSYIDSDMASEMVLAHVLNQEGSIVSSNWWYSTEIRVFGAQWFYRIGLWLLPENWYGAG